MSSAKDLMEIATPPAVQLRARPRARADGGFTLIEMAIAVAVLGLLLGGGLLGVAAFFEKAKFNQTLTNLDKAEAALTLFVLQNSRLPCPATTLSASGAEGTCSGSTTYYGRLPYLAMGLQRKEAMDGYGRYLAYVVDDAYVAGTPLVCNTTAFSGLTGAIAVNDSTGNAPTGTAAAAYALISHGLNGLGGVMSTGTAFAEVPTSGNQPSEYANSRLDSTNPKVIWQEPASGTNVGFDDIVRSRPPARILYDGGCVSG